MIGNTLNRTLRPRARQARLRLEALEDRVVPSLVGNQLFPADNPWNQKITTAPVSTSSATWVASIGLNSALHPDFGTQYGGALNGIPFNIVPGTQAPVHVVIDAYANESDLVPIPIPTTAVIEGDPLPGNQNTSDRHLLVYDKDNNIVYETFNTHRPSEESDGQWHADSEAVWDLKKDTFRPPGWTSADAAGLPILPGLVRTDEVLDQGLITHALRFTVPRSQNTYIYPASHQAGVNNASYPPMGARFRLKQSFDISGFSPANRVILQALKDYGMIVADNGSGWYLSGAPDSRWNDSDLHSLSQVLGNNFEAVDLTPKVSTISPASGPAAGGNQLTINGLNFSGAAGMMKVFFGTISATGITVVSDTQILVTVPPQAAGTVNVTVKSPYGTSAVVATDQYTYVATNPLAGQFQFSSATYSTNEGNSTFTVTVNRVSGSQGVVTVAYATVDGTARAAIDYLPAAGVLTFNQGDTTKTFTITLRDDNGGGESDESLGMVLSNPTGGASLGSPTTATLTLHEDSDAKAATPIIATGADAGGGPEVRVLNALTGAALFDFYAYDSNFSGGVRVAVGDVTGDHIPDIITAPGPSGGPDIRVFDGATGVMIKEWMAYDSHFTGGVFVAAGDVNADGFADVITGADAGGGPHVEVFSGKDLTLLQSFFAYGANFKGGVRVAAGDVDGDGKADIITAPGPGGGPHVKVFQGGTGALLQSFMAYAPGFTGGVYIAAGDIDADGKADIFTSPGAGGGPHVQVFSGASGAILQSFMAYSASFTGGVRVAAADINGDGRADIIVGGGPGLALPVEAFDAGSLASLDNFFAYGPVFAGGVFVGGH